MSIKPVFWNPSQGITTGRLLGAKGSVDTKAGSPHGEAGDIFRAAKSLRQNEQMVLKALAHHAGDFNYVGFRTIADSTMMPIRVVRRLTRALARKGLAEYAKGLFNEDGEVAGAGYAATQRGKTVAQILGD